MHIIPVILKKLFISQFFKQIKLCICLFLFKKKIFFTSKNVYVMFMFTSWRLLEQYILRVRVFIDHLWSLIILPGLVAIGTAVVEI